MSACRRHDAADEPSSCTRDSRVVRRVDTTKGQLTVDLSAKVECTDWQVAGALQIHVHEISRVVRAIDLWSTLRRLEYQGNATNGQLTELL